MDLLYKMQLCPLESFTPWCESKITRGISLNGKKKINQKIKIVKVCKFEFLEQNTVSFVQYCNLCFSDCFPNKVMFIFRFANLFAIFIVFVLLHVPHIGLREYICKFEQV